MTELYINNQLIDLFDEVDIFLNFTLNNIKNVFERKTNFSKNFKVPHTNNNKKIFNYLFNINTINSTWNYVKVDCSLYEDGVEIFKGFVSLKNIINENNKIIYDITLIGVEKGLFEDMGKFKLTDLTWDDTNDFHKYNLSSVRNSSNFTSDISSWFYPLLDYGLAVSGNTATDNLQKNFSTMNVDDMSEYFKPCVFIKSIIDKIFTDDNRGYTYECELFEETWFKNLFIPFNNSELEYNDADVSVYNSYQNLNFTNINTGDWNLLYPLQAGNHAKIIEPDVIGLDTYGGYTTDLYFDLYNVGISGNYKIDFSTKVNGLTIIPPFGTPTKEQKPGIYIYVVDEAGNEKSSKNIYELSTSDIGNTISTEYNLKLVKGDSVLIFGVAHALWDNKAVWPQKGDLLISDSTIDFKLVDFKLAIFGAENSLNVSNFIKNGVTQRDFFLSILKMFNLYITIDKYNNKNYIIKTRDQFYIDGESYNWSDKLLKDKIISNNLKPYDFHTYVLSFKENNDFHNTFFNNINGKVFGNKSISTLNPESNNINDKPVVFSPTPFIYNKSDKLDSYLYITSTKKYPVAKINWEDEDGSGGNVINTLKKGKYKGTPRILMKWDKSIDTTDLVLPLYNGSDTTLKYLTNYSTGVQFDYEGDNGEIDISYDQDIILYIDTSGLTQNTNNFTNLYSYWSDNINNLFNSDSRIITAYFNLTLKDVSNFSLDNKIFVDLGENLGSGWFLVNKIIDYNPRKTETKVELIKIIDGSQVNIQYGYTPIGIGNFDLIDGGSDSILITSPLLDGGQDDILITSPKLDAGTDSVLI